MTKAVHASNIPSDLPRSPLQPGLSGDLAQDRDAFAAFLSQCDELRLRFPPKPSRTAAEATVCAAIFAAERKARGEFLQLNVDEVYNKLTCYSREFIRAEQLVADAALARSTRRGSRTSANKC